MEKRASDDSTRLGALESSGSRRRGRRARGEIPGADVEEVLPAGHPTLRKWWGGVPRLQRSQNQVESSVDLSVPI